MTGSGQSDARHGAVTAPPGPPPATLATQSLPPAIPSWPASGSLGPAPIARRPGRPPAARQPRPASPVNATATCANVGLRDAAAYGQCFAVSGAAIRARLRGVLPKTADHANSRSRDDTLAACTTRVRMPPGRPLTGGGARPGRLCRPGLVMVRAENRRAASRLCSVPATGTPAWLPENLPAMLSGPATGTDGQAARPVRAPSGASRQRLASLRRSIRLASSPRGIALRGRPPIIRRMPAGPASTDRPPGLAAPEMPSPETPQHRALSAAIIQRLASSPATRYWP